MRKTWMLPMILWSLWSGGANAASAADRYAQCAQLKDDRDRLACFDSLAASTDRSSKQRAVAYEEVSLADLETDIQHFIGKHVTTTGRFTLKGDVGMLQSGAMDGSPVTILVGKIDRATQDALLSDCSYISPDRGCSVRVSGIVVAVPLSAGIRAERLTFN